MQSHVWDKCFTEIKALNTEGDLGKIIEWKLLLRPEICTKSKGLGEAVGCRVSIADDAVAVAPRYPCPCATGPPRLVLPGAGWPPRAQTHNCCRRGDGERCPGQMEARLRQQSVPRCPAPRSARGMPVIPPAAPLIQTLSSPAQRGRLGAHSPSSSGGLIKGLAQNKKPVSRHKMCSPPLVPPRKLKTGACGVRGSLRGRTGRGDEEGKGRKGEAGSEMFVPAVVSGAICQVLLLQRTRLPARSEPEEPKAHFCVLLLLLGRVQHILPGCSA